MTQEEKELLFKDLCSRLPYGVKVEIDGYNIGVLKGIDGDTISTDRGINYPLRLVKPYLHPMSSMTEEDRDELSSVPFVTLYDNGDLISNGQEIDWLNKKHLDYRGLIPMGLALEAPEDMYKKN